MKRRVLRIGKASLAVTLPSKWARHYNLEPGTEIELKENEGSVQIITGKHSSEKEITITMPPAKEFAKRLIFSPYIQGYDTIRVKYQDLETKKRIEESVNYLMGCDIVDQKKEFLILKIVAKGLEEEYPNLFNRMVHLVGEIIETMKEAAAAKEKTVIEEAESYDTMLNKLNNFTRRLINTMNGKSLPENTANYRVTCGVEEVGDDCMHICSYLKTHKFPENLARQLACVQDIHKAFYDLHSKPTTKKLAHFKYLCKEGQDEMRNTEEGFCTTKIFDIIERYRAITEDILFPFEEHR